MKFFPFIFIILLIAGCSSSRNIDEKSKLNVNVNKVDCWLNLMPGGPGSFHIAGEITVKNNEEFNIDSLQLVRVNIFQNDKVIYSFVPFFNLLNDQVKELKINDEKKYLFGTDKMLEIKKLLDESQNVNAELEFLYDKKSFSYLIKEIKVEKVY
jgi:hypothetical protein